VHEVKFDGWRIHTNVLNDTVRRFTRNDLDRTKEFPALAKQVRALDNCIIDGELSAIPANSLACLRWTQGRCGRQGYWTHIQIVICQLLRTDGTRH
jgi:ATP-dependent DNA ligase